MYQNHVLRTWIFFERAGIREGIEYDCAGDRILEVTFYGFGRQETFCSLWHSKLESMIRVPYKSKHVSVSLKAVHEKY